MITHAIAIDLEPTLLEWQVRGMSLWRWMPSLDGVAAPFVIEKRSWPRRLLQAVRRGALQRRTDGSYGRLVLEARSSGG